MKAIESGTASLAAVPDAELREEIRCAMERFPGRLRQIREAGSMTLREAGEGTGIKRQQIAAYERGEVLPDFKNIRLLASYYGVSVDWLMGGNWE